MKTSNCQTEVNGEGAWEKVPVAWLDEESFAPRFAQGKVSGDFVLWSGNDSPRRSPAVSSGDTTTFWKRSMSFAPDV